MKNTRQILRAASVKKIFLLENSGGLGIRLISHLKFEVNSPRERRGFMDPQISIGLIEAFICPRVPVEFPAQQETCGKRRSAVTPY